MKKYVHFYLYSCGCEHLFLFYSERHLPTDLGSFGDFENAADAAYPSANAWSRLPSISRMVDAQELRRKRRHQFRASASLDNCKKLGDSFYSFFNGCKNLISLFLWMILCAVPEELEGADNPSKLLPNEAPVRNAYSSPKEHFERLSDCLDMTSLQRESTAPLSSQTSKTPRKQMKHDDGLVNTKSTSSKNNGSLSSKERLPEQLMLSLDVGNFPSEMLTPQNVSTATGRNLKEASTNSSELEQNLFGPNISSGARDSHGHTEVDGGVFGENLHGKLCGSI